MLQALRRVVNPVMTRPSASGAYTQQLPSDPAALGDIGVCAVAPVSSSISARSVARPRTTADLCWGPQQRMMVRAIIRR